MKALLTRTDRWLLRMDTILVSIAGLAILAMMGVTTADVFMRYALNAPLRWGFDLITQYLLIASFFFAFSYTLRANENVAVDFFAHRFPSGLHRIMLAAGYGTSALIFAFVTWLSAWDTHEAWRNNEAFVGALVWPSWYAKVLVPIGAAALVLRLVHRSLAYAFSVGDDEVLHANGLEDNRSLVLKE